MTKEPMYYKLYSSATEIHMFGVGPTGGGENERVCARTIVGYIHPAYIRTLPQN